MTDLCNDWKNEYIEDISYLDKNIFVNFYICYISICTSFVKDLIYMNITETPY